jgi:hypothetical protein
MTTEFYLPMLKSKSGEFDALFRLSTKCKEKIVPLFEVTPKEFDHDSNSKPKTLQQHLITFCKKIIKKWPTNNCFIDTNLINDQEIEGIECIEFIYSELAEKNIFPMPVISLKSNEHINNAIKNILALNQIQDIGLRIDINDVTSSLFRENLDELLTALDVAIDDCHIIFDLKDSAFSQKEDFSDAILDLLKDFPYFHQWKSFSIVGGAFPSMGTIKKNIDYIPRHDWLFYKYLVRKFSQESFYRPINYGDYSIVTPGYFEFDPKKMSRSANIRYTHDKDWLVVKGRALKVSADWQQYFEQAKKIVESAYYLGENYSDGDLHIKKCADKKTTSGNSNTWIRVGSNHHFTKVLNDLFATNS